MIDWQILKDQIQENPKHMVGAIAAIAGCFLLIWILVIVQTDTSSRTVVVDNEGRLDSLRFSLNEVAPDSATVRPAYPAKAEDTSTGVLPIFLIMAAAIGGLWYWIKRSSSGNSPMSSAAEDKIFTRLGTQPMSHGHKLSLIKINGEYWVLNVNEQKVELLHRYSSSEWEGTDEREWAEPGSPETKPTEGKAIFSTIFKKETAKDL